MTSGGDLASMAATSAGRNIDNGASVGICSGSGSETASLGICSGMDSGSTRNSDVACVIDHQIHINHQMRTERSGERPQAEALANFFPPDTVAAPVKRNELLRFIGVVNGRTARVLIDEGATHDVINVAFARLAGLVLGPETNSEATNAITGTTSVTVCGPLKPVALSLGKFKCMLGIDTVITDVAGYDVLLGMPWHYDHEPKPDYRKKRLVLRDASGILHVLQCRSTWDRSVAYGVNTVSIRESVRLMRRQTAELHHIVVTEAVSEVSGEGVSFSSKSDDGFRKLVTAYADVFPRDLPEGLPPKRKEEFEIRLEPGSRPPKPRGTRLSHAASMELQLQLERLLELGMIRPSSSPYGASVFFVHKADGGWRMVSDWRSLNEMTIKDSTTLPNMYELLDSLKSAKYLSKLDLNGGFNQIRVRESDVPKTAMRTALGSYEWTVMPMGLTNAPATFQRMMNRVLRAFIGKSVLVYLDDILVFSETREQHLIHLEEVFGALRRERLYAKPSKCLIAAEEINFLGHVVGNGCLKVDPLKTQAVREMKPPTNVHGMRRFLGFANFFRRFIRGFSEISIPLHALTHKNAHFVWSEECQTAFDALREALLSAPVLRLPDFDRPFILSTDASNVAIGAVLMQEDDLGNRFAVAYRSRTLTEVARNWPTHEREMFAIVDSIIEWKYYLEGLQSFMVETDHKPLIHMMQQRDLSAKQLRWITKLANFKFRLVYKPGSTQVVSDWLSRPEDSSLSSATPELEVNDWRHLCKERYSDDKFFLTIKASKRFRLSDDGLWHLHEDGKLESRLCVPTQELQQLVLRELHDVAIAGHPGRDRLYAQARAAYFWPGMSRDVEEFVQSCPRCQRSKPRTHRTPGLHQPLSVPVESWRSVSMDFMTDLPRTPRGRDALMVVVDRFTKMVHLTAMRKADGAEEIARLFVRDIFRLHGLPSDIVSDRDSRFTSKFWGSLWAQLGTTLSLSTASHPQSDGQTERANRTINEMIRTIIEREGPDWESLLPQIEFAYNNGQQASTHMSPFFAVYGQHPRTPLNASISSTRADDSVVSNIAEGGMAAKHEFITSAIKDALVKAQEVQRNATNRHRADQAFSIGDSVLVAADRVHGGPPMNTEKYKWQELWRGPFTIQSRVGENAYQLAMPEWFEGHPTFNISHLKPWVSREAMPAAESALPSMAQTMSEGVADNDVQDDRENAFNSMNSSSSSNDVTTTTTTTTTTTDDENATAGLTELRRSARAPVPNQRYLTPELVLRGGRNVTGRREQQRTVAILHL